MGSFCAKVGCYARKAHGLFCEQHRVVRPIESNYPLCCAKGCSWARKSLSLFCDMHQRAMDRECVSPKAFDTRVEPFRAPLPDRKCVPVRVVKAAVKWDGFQFVSVHPDFVAGFGASPGAAMRDMTKDYGDGIPF